MICAEIPILDIEEEQYVGNEIYMRLRDEPLQCRPGDNIIVYTYFNGSNGIVIKSEAMLLKYLGNRVARLIGYVKYRH